MLKQARPGFGVANKRVKSEVVGESDLAFELDGIPALAGLTRSRGSIVEKPLLVLVNGPAAGAGLGLSLIGDVVLASDKASFTAAYGMVGLSPDGGVSWLLPRLVGLRKAQKMLFLNETVLAEEAERIGLVTAVVPHDDLFEEGRKLAEKLAAGAVDAIGKTRSLLLHSYENAYESHLAMETRLIMKTGASPECDEGVAAFLGKRKPDFRGV